jgi:hypothetical protein
MLHRSREGVETGWTPVWYERSADRMAHTAAEEEWSGATLWWRRSTDRMRYTVQGKKYGQDTLDRYERSTGRMGYTVVQEECRQDRLHCSRGGVPTG